MVTTKRDTEEGRISPEEALNGFLLTGKLLAGLDTGGVAERVMKLLADHREKILTAPTAKEAAQSPLPINGDPMAVVERLMESGEAVMAPAAAQSDIADRVALLLAWDLEKLDTSVLVFELLMIIRKLQDATGVAVDPFLTHDQRTELSRLIYDARWIAWGYPKADLPHLIEHGLTGFKGRPIDPPWMRGIRERHKPIPPMV